MIPVVAEKSTELEELCRRYRVARLDLFGAAAMDQFHFRDSDLDFLVEFQSIPFGDYANTYFGLLEALERLFGRSVDLVVNSAIKNPYFMQSIEQTRKAVYET